MVEEKRIEICIGCKKTIEDTEDNMRWNKEYEKWHYNELGMLCEKCYPVFKNILPIIKKKSKEFFVEARKEMNFSFYENMRGMY